MLHRSRMESEMDAELHFHIEAYADDLERSGVPRAEAMRRARIEFGGIERVKEEGREARGVRFLDRFVDGTMTQDDCDFYFDAPGCSPLRNAGANRKVQRREPLLILLA
jgi:hypothetical protein